MFTIYLLSAAITGAYLLKQDKNMDMTVFWISVLCPLINTMLALYIIGMKFSDFMLNLLNRD